MWTYINYENEYKYMKYAKMDYCSFISKYINTTKLAKSYFQLPSSNPFILPYYGKRRSIPDLQPLTTLQYTCM